VQQREEDIEPCYLSPLKYLENSREDKGKRDIHLHAVISIEILRRFKRRQREEKPYTTRHVHQSLVTD
jgi:hypothetical protein